MRRGVVVVSGASSGIGAVCARHLAQMGYTVVAGTRSVVLPQSASGIHHVTLDITDTHSIAQAVDYAVSLAGSGGLAGLVNNAGICVMGPVETLPPDAMRRQFDVNVFGTIALTQACLPALRTGRGRVVIMSSIAGRTSMACAGAYSASKFALEAFADALRLEVRRWGLRVSLVEPGAVETAMWKKVDASWAGFANVGGDLEVLYGDTVAHMRQAVATYGRTAMPPEHVARAVAHALTSRRPKTRYLVGAEARARAALQAWLPDRLHDALVRLVMRLP